MTKSEFNLIIIESLAHEQRQFFFKGKQKGKKPKDGGYSRKGFGRGLMDSFKWLNTEVNKTDYCHYRLRGPNGNAEDGKISKDPQIYREQLAELEKRGVLSFPFKKVIEIRNEMNGQLIYKLTSKSMATIWPAVHIYVFPCFDTTEPIPTPPVLTSEGHDKAWDQIILVPEKVARYFLEPESGISTEEEIDQVHPFHEDDFIDGEIKSDDVQLHDSDSKGNKFMNRGRDKQSGNLTEESQELISMKLSLNQIALKYAWEGIPITRENRDEIAGRFGYKSGNKLHQNYCKVMRRSVRISDPDGSPTIMLNKIELFESVIELLPEVNKKEACEELKILQSIFEKSYLKKL